MFVVRKDKSYLRCVGGKRYMWTPQAEMATAFASFGEAVIRAEKLGLDARDINVEPKEIQ